MQTVFRERGFTILELVVVGFFLLLCIGGSFVLIHPKDFGAQRRDAARLQDVAQMMQVLNRYVADNGQLPADLPAKTTNIGNQQGEVDLCKDFTAHLTDIPMDPLAGGEQSSKNCASSDAVYTTGYAIVKSSNNTVTISAPYAEMGDKISLTRRF